MRISDWSSDVCSSDLLYINPDARGSGSSGFRRRFAFRLDDLALLALVQLWRRIAFDDARQRASLPAHDDAAEPVEGVLPKIGRASCRERVCPYVSISVEAVSLTKKKQQKQDIS